MFTRSIVVRRERKENHRTINRQSLHCSVQFLASHESLKNFSCNLEAVKPTKKMEKWQNDVLNEFDEQIQKTKRPRFDDGVCYFGSIFAVIGILNAFHCLHRILIVFCPFDFHFFFQVSLVTTNHDAMPMNTSNTPSTSQSISGSSTVPIPIPSDSEWSSFFDSK